MRRRSKIVINDETRLFIQDVSQPACNKDFNYHSCIVLGDISQAKSDTTKHYYPSDTHYDQFKVYATIPGLPQPGSSSLETNFTSDASILGQYYRTKCLFDMHVHMGKCSNPTDFSKFEKCIIFKDVHVDNYTIRSPMTARQADRSPVTESLDFTFEQMYEVSKPELYLIESEVVDDGPILESFTFCSDQRCSLCEGTTGRYFIQIVSCGEECAVARVVYTLDNGDTWRVKHINICDDIGCAQFVNGNIIRNGTDLHYVHLNTGLGKTITQIVDNSVETIPVTSLMNTQILRGHTKYTTAFYIGTNGRIYISNADGFRRIIHSKLDITTDILSIHSLNGIDFVAGSQDGKVYIGNVDGEIESLVIPNAGNIYNVEMISECSFIASTGTSGGVLFRGGKMTRIKGIRGAITKFAFFNEDIGYASSISGNTVYFWQTVDGGKNWQELNQTLPTNYVVTSLTVCDLDYNVITIAGRKMSSAVSVNDVLNPELDWNCLGEGFVVFSK